MTEAQKDYKKEMGKLRTCLGSLPGGVESEIEMAKEAIRGISTGVVGTQATLEDTNDAISRVVEAIDRVGEAIDQHRLELSRYSGIPVEITNLRHMLDAAMEDLSRKVSILDMGGSK